MKSKITYLLSMIVVLLAILVVLVLPVNKKETVNETPIEATSQTPSEIASQTPNEKSEVNLKGDLTKLSQSNDTLKNISVGNTKEDVMKTFNSKPIKSEKLNSQEYDFFERYEIDGKKYDAYYLKNKLVGMTAF